MRSNAGACAAVQCCAGGVVCRKREVHTSEGLARVVEIVHQAIGQAGHVACKGGAVGLWPNVGACRHRLLLCPIAAGKQDSLTSSHMLGQTMG